MAALVADETLDLDELRRRYRAALPHYARPVFVRIAGRLDVTGTFKPRKVNLVAEIDGDDPDFDHPEKGRLELLDQELYRWIESGVIRL